MSSDLLARLRTAVERKRRFWADPTLPEEEASVALHRAEADLMEEAANLLKRLTCESCDGTGEVTFCPCEPPSERCQGCETAACPDCAVQP